MSPTLKRRAKRRARELTSRFRGSFRRSIDDPNSPIALDVAPRSDTLLVAFGGMRGQVGMPPFEFFKATGEIPVKRLFVRDLRQAWYHRGVPGHGETIDEVGANLLELADANGVERLVTTGNSAGGYAALVFGILLGADAVLCFAPQTVLEPAVLDEIGDHRWDEQLRELLDADALDPRWADLARALPDAAPLSAARERRPRAAVYYDATYDADRFHAERLAAVPGLELHARQGGAHGLVREMRASGELDSILRGVLA